jgi:tRNA(fMet)-specific endonuclease VapC
LKAAVLRHFGPQHRAAKAKSTIADIGISENDLWIAAVVKRYDLTLVSGDSDFERIGEVTDLKRESWIHSPT